MLTNDQFEQLKRDRDEAWAKVQAAQQAANDARDKWSPLYNLANQETLRREIIAEIEKEKAGGKNV